MTETKEQKIRELTDILRGAPDGWGIAAFEGLDVWGPDEVKIGMYDDRDRDLHPGNFHVRAAYTISGLRHEDVVAAATSAGVSIRELGVADLDGPKEHQYRIVKPLYWHIMPKIPSTTPHDEGLKLLMASVRRKNNKNY